MSLKPRENEGTGFETTYALVRALFHEPARNNPELRRMAGLLHAVWHAASTRERVDYFAELAEWTRAPDASFPALAQPNGLPLPEMPPEWRRLKIAISILERSPELRALHRSFLATVLAETQSVSLLAEAGLPSDRGLFSEAAERIFRRILPTPHEDQDLSRLLTRLFPDRRMAERFAGMPPGLFERLAATFSPGPRNDAWAPVYAGMHDALRLLALRVQALGMSDKMRTRQTISAVTESPFFRLPRRLDELLEAMSAGRRHEPALEAWREESGRCWQELIAITRRLESTGVNLDIVYSQEVIAQCLGRMEAIVSVLTARSDPEKTGAVRDLLEGLIRGRISDRSLTALAQSTLRLLATKIIEHAGKTGEHYIALTRSEYWAIWKAGIGGGAITAATAALKMKVTHAGFPPFVEGFLAGLNYAVSFVVIQILHFVLATKQPSMTAAAFAGIIRSKRGTARLEELSTYIARICSSQLAAAIGNVAAVAFTAALISSVWRLITGATYLTAEESFGLFESLNPYATGTAFFAALTGVILWLSSVVGGWIDNWAIYRKLPQALAEHPLGHRWGRKPLERIAEVLSPNVAAWGGSIALGFMLGMVHPVGTFFGIPLDVRHVTLTSGTWALATASLDLSVFQRGPFLWAIPGLAVIFVFNLSVSFTIALLVAMRAYGISAREHLQLLKTVFLRLVKSPGDFLLPPASGSQGAESPPTADH